VSHQSPLGGTIDAQFTSESSSTYGIEISL